MIKLETTRQRRIRKLRETKERLLDAIFSPVISRLTDEQYFACHTRIECLSFFLRARLAR